jgi:hypothetical protein
MRWEVVAISAALTGCSVPRDVHLYPANEAATAGGVVTLHFVAHGTGHTEVDGTLPNGEVLKGELTLLRGGSVGLSSTFASVAGAGGTAAGSAASVSSETPGTSPGTISMFGDRGTGLLCEMMNDNTTAHGVGACRTSSGATYRMSY